MKKRIVIIELFVIITFLVSGVLGQQSECLDSDGVTEIKEINEGESNVVSGFDIRVDSADETNRELNVELNIDDLYSITLSSNNPLY
ncbi:MAG: hypothetical protein Q7S27_05755 [Nanoarchaeota archaeon]|nr:hypothetical protein [Nanoarchaeota archaeon]